MMCLDFTSLTSASLVSINMCRVEKHADVVEGLEIQRKRLRRHNGKIVVTTGLVRMVYLMVPEGRRSDAIEINTISISAF
jgi:hypothetical protein